MLLAMIGAAMAVTSGAQAALDVALTDLKLGMSAGFTCETAQVATREAEALIATAFRKTGTERRLLAFEGRPAGNPEGAQTLRLRYSLQLDSGQAPRLAVVVFDADGGTWTRVGGTIPATTGPTDGVLSVATLRQAAFSEDKSGKLEWASVQRVWVGILLDGPAEGILAVFGARFSDEPYKATKPLRVTGDGPGNWSVGCDPAVKATLTTPDEGPEGKPCMKVEFSVPGGRHMYMIPSVSMPADDQAGYSALRFTYKAAIPKGMRLLVTLGERRGGAYYVEPPGPWPLEWTTITLPFSEFREAGWAKDPDHIFQTDQIGSVMIGSHGVPETDNTGYIMVSDVELIP